ncbi:hypothetical protein [Ovoidimarina sediminis]|uniref:hypothetical protein n=1 Tax=Ovoidimarina sediminis TaxID=3079856 RepID=UPI002913E0E3|nr:hypothetical protein [Rhodophyticola sp. MJ-SS7]MDU8944720.1 hypothetical protein [Rhodophyticola sp. MJ-SS7]
MRKRIRKAIRKLKSGRPGRALHALVTPHHSETRIESARARVAAHLTHVHGGRVAHGPFRGMVLPETTSWGRHDVSGKILGTYEQHVVDLLEAWRSEDGLLIDLGAADGYFAVGALRAGFFGRALCFEMSEKGRRALAAAAEINGVRERVRIEGEATEAALLAAVPEGARGTVLCDIEGAEFSLLTETVLERLSGMSIIVELHDFLFEGGREALGSRAAAWFDLAIVRAGPVDPGAFTELDGFDDDHRLLAFSEGREVMTEWMVLTPKGRA